MKKSFLIILMISLFVLVGCGQLKQSENQAKEDTSLNDIKDKGSFVLGISDSMPPLGFVDRNGEMAGFDLDLMKEVATRMSLELQVQVYQENGISELKSKDIDVLSGFSIIPENQKNMSFSKPFLNKDCLVIIRKDSNIQSVDDFKDKKIGVQINSDSQNIIEANETIKTTVSELIPFETNQKAIMELGTGKIDAVIVDYVFGKYIIAERPSEFKLFNEILGNFVYGFGFRISDNTFRIEVDRVLDEMKEDGTLENISRKWFGEDIVLQ